MKTTIENSTNNTMDNTIKDILKIKYGNNINYDEMTELIDCLAVLLMSEKMNLICDEYQDILKDIRTMNK